MLWSTSMGYKGLDLVSWIVLRLIPVLTATAQCLLALFADLREGLTDIHANARP